MAAKEKKYNRSIENESEELGTLNLMEILGLCLSNWYWFVLCLSLSMGIAAIYLRIVPPIYSRSTAIAIKDDSQGRELDNIFSRYRTGRNTSASFNNEIIALQKPALIEKVVRRLNLNVEYQIRGHLRNTTLYGSSVPATVEIPGQDAACEFKFHIDEAGNVILKSDDNWGKKLILGSQEYTGRVNQKIKTPIGNIIVHPAPGYTYRSGDYITVSRKSVASTTSKILKNLSVANTNEESTVIDVSLKDVNIERADDILNTIIAVYNEQWIENRNQVIIATNKFIGERLNAIEYELGDVEAELSSYRVASHTIDYMEEGTRYVDRSIQYENQNMSFQNELALTNYFKDYISKVKDINQTLPLSAGINNSALAEQVSQYNTLLLERNNLVSASSEANPLVADKDKQLAVLLHGIKVTIDNHIGTLNTQLHMLSANEERNNAAIDATPGRQKQYIDIERRRKIKEQLYTYLLQTREQNELNQAFAAYNTRVLQPAGGSNVQTFPNVNKVLLIAFGIGFLLPFALIVLREWMNTKIRGRKDIEKLTIPFVGELPFVELVDPSKISFLKRIKDRIVEFNKDIFSTSKTRRKRKADKLHTGERVVVKAGSRNVINEAYRVLRTNLEFIIGHNSSQKVIMSTSANPGSGKTFISYNLALCMSLKRKKVCVIDLDLRRHNLSAYVGTPDVGISDYINGSVEDWHDIVIKSPDGDHLDVIPVGTVPPNPAEILAYDSFGRLIEELRKEYDYIFFDCPPVEIVADTSIIAKYADITLFVIRVGLMELGFTHIIEEYYDQRKFNNMGIILNGTLTANSRYGYRRYGYRYGYGYGYGYGGYGYYGSGYSSGYSDGYSSGYTKDDKK